MRKVLFLSINLIISIIAVAQFEVKENSFKKVEGFVNLNPDIQYDDNDKPYSVLKVRTENINNEQRHQLLFEGDLATYFEVEYKVGEVWLYISYYATYIKISHPDFGSTEFSFPFDMLPKCGYELTLVNKTADVVKLNKSQQPQNVFTKSVIRFYIDSSPQGADVYWRVISSAVDVKNTNQNYLGTTPYESTETLDIKGLTADNLGEVQIEITCEKRGYIVQKKRFNLLEVVDQKEVSVKMNMVKDE